MADFFVYVLRNAAGTTYTGIAKDAAARLAAHNAGAGARFTRGRGPWVLVHVEGPLPHGDALRREAAIKRDRRFRAGLAATASTAGPEGPILRAQPEERAMPPDSVRQADPSEIPVIDIGALSRGDGDAGRRLAARIVHAAENTGFLYVTGHGVPRALIDAVFTGAEAFFALPEAEKLEIGLARSTCFRGYLPLDSRGADPTKRNYLEAFQMQAELPADDPDARAGRNLFGPNQWPARPAGLRETMLAYYAAMDDLSDRLLRAFAVGIDLPEDFFLSWYAKPLTQLRLLHYPPHTPDIEEGVLGARVHSDTGAFTILLQDSNGGLEVETPSGEWVAATPLDGAFVVNIGDMLENWTNGRFISIRHRVVNRSGRERYSIPYFVNPDFDAVVRPLPEFTGEENLARFEPVHVGSFIGDRFESIWPRKTA